MIPVLLMKEMNIERWSDFPKVTQLVRSKAGIWTQSDSRICLFLLLHTFALYQLIKLITSKLCYEQ